MALSVLNKKFLGHLKKLNIDIKQFPDLTFDGLFDNVPEDMNYFFDWFIENITPDNALTPSEQAIYFQLEKTQSLRTEEELNYVLSSSNPSYEELMSLDVNYINNYLLKDLEDLTKYQADLSNIQTEVEEQYRNIIFKQNNVKEKITAKKKLLNSVTQESRRVNSSLESKVDEVKMFLLQEPELSLCLDSFNDLLWKERNILNKFYSSHLLEKEILSCTKLDSLSELEEDLICVDMSLVLSEGFLKGQRAKVEFLSELVQKRSSQKGFSSYKIYQSYHMNKDGIDMGLIEEIKALESELFKKQKSLSHAEVQKIADEYYFKRMDLNKSYVMKLTECRDYIKMIAKTKSLLLHILLRCIASVEEVRNTRKELYSKLDKYGRIFSNDVTNLELRNQRFKEASQQNHPLTLKNEGNLIENPETNQGALKNILELLLHATDDSNFITHKHRNDMQRLIQAFFTNTLCGPTNQILYAPVELLIKFQKYKEEDNKLSQVVKRLASRYVDAKQAVSGSDRKRLLLWVDFLTNPQGLLEKIKQLSLSSRNEKKSL